MKIKIQVLVMMFVAALAFSACSDDDDNNSVTVPEAVSKALETKYPAATHIEWKQKGSYFVADCRMDGKEMDVWFNSGAEWLLTETDLLWVNLPGTVQTAFSNSEYASWKREDIDMLEYRLQPLQFVIEVEKGNTEYLLFYSEDGSLMQTRDVSGKDDTHWPVENM